MSFYNNLLISTTLIVTLLIKQKRCDDKEIVVFPLKDAEITGDDIPFLKLENSRFSIGRKRVMQAEALTICEKTGPEDRLAVLSTIGDAYDLTIRLFNISDKYTPEYDTQNATTEWGPDRRYWIGLIDYIQEGDWQWAKSKSEYLTYEFWTNGQPDHNTGRNKRLEHCASLWNPNYFKAGEFHTFNDEDCTSKYYFICEDVPAEISGNTGNAIPQGRSIGRLLHIDNQDDSDGLMPSGVVVEDMGGSGRPSVIASDHVKDQSLEMLSKESDDLNEIDIDHGLEGHKDKVSRSLMTHRTTLGGRHFDHDPHGMSQDGEISNNGLIDAIINITLPVITDLNKNNITEHFSYENTSNENFRPHSHGSNSSGNIITNSTKVTNVNLQNASIEIVHFHDVINQSRGSMINTTFTENTSSEIIHFHNDVNYDPIELQPTSSTRRSTLATILPTASSTSIIDPKKI